MSVVATAPQQFLQSTFALRARRQIKELYSFLLAFSFAQGLILIFEPVFLYQIGLPIAAIALYYAVHYLAYFLLLPLGASFAARFGYERSLAVSTPVLILYFLTLAGMGLWPQLLWFAPLLLAWHKMFYWPAYHATFSAYSYKGDFGREQSWQRLITYGAGITAPFLGGIIVSTLGYPTLFVVTAATLSLAGMLLLRTPEKIHIAKMPYAAAWRIIKQRRERRLVLGSLGWAEHLIHLVVWPIALYIVVRQPVMMGLIASISVGIMSLWGFLIGRWSDEYSPRQVLKSGVIVIAISYALRCLAVLPGLAFLADVVARLSNATMEIPFLSQLYKDAGRREPLAYVTAFEIVLSIAKAVTALALALIFWFLPINIAFVIAFVIGALAAWLYGRL